MTGPTANEPLVGAIEAGGTKFRVGVAQGREFLADTTVPTTSPGETIGATLDFFRRFTADGGGELDAVGIASFGPLDLDPDSDNFGSIVATPKPGWSGFDLRGSVADALEVPVAIDVDVNGAALAEWTWGAAQGLSTFVYMTVGTGIGGGLYAEGRLHHGLGHPEMGHVVVAPIEGDDFPGRCPFHGSCLEGMASGPAIEDRWGAPGSTLGDRPEVWELQARYLAQGLRSITYVGAPERIVLGGGVMQRPGLVEMVERELQATINGYGASPAITSDLDGFVVAPALGQDAGFYGAAALGTAALGTAALGAEALADHQL